MTGHQLRVERVKKNLKQIELAQKTGIPRERLSRFENGWEALQAEELHRILEVLDQIPECVATARGRPTPAANLIADAKPESVQALSPEENER